MRFAARLARGSVALAMLASLLVLVTPPAGAAPPNRADYADQCAAEMGTIPGFNCLDGELLDITVNGVSQSQPTASGNCDKPVQLGLAGNQCVPFSRLLRIDTGKPSVTTIAICRKYFASSGPQDQRFDDIAMIQHNKATGRTCFFQSKLESNLDGRSVPSPSDRTAAGSNYWLENTNGGPNGIPCSSCHAADPFIWSTFVAQKADLSKWDPLGKYDSNFAGLFGAYGKVFSPAGNACTSCHRFGKGPANDLACNSFPTRYTGHLPDATNPAEFVMPPGFGTNASAWHSSFDTAFAQIQRCCANPDLAECRSRVANDEAPDDGSRFAAIWVKQAGPVFVARHGLTSQQYQQAFDTFVGQQGYCLIDVSGYQVNGEARYAAIWEKKTCPSFVARHGLTSQQYQQAFDTLVGQQGYRLKLVNGYEVGGQDFYAAIFEKSPGPAFTARHGLTSQQYQQEFDTLIGQGYCLSLVSGYAAGNEDRYAAIWEKQACPPFVARHGMTSQEYQQQFDTLVGQQGYHLKLVSGHKVGNQTSYAAIWEKSPSPAFVARHGLTSEEYQQAFDTLVGQQGYRLIWVDGY